jgi:hypothetical protein
MSPHTGWPLNSADTMDWRHRRRDFRRTVCRGMRRPRRRPRCCRWGRRGPRQR